MAEQQRRPPSKSGGLDYPSWVRVLPHAPKRRTLYFDLRTLIPALGFAHTGSEVSKSKEQRPKIVVSLGRVA